MRKSVLLLLTAVICAVVFAPGCGSDVGSPASTEAPADGDTGATDGDTDPVVIPGTETCVGTPFMCGEKQFCNLASLKCEDIVITYCDGDHPCAEGLSCISMGAGSRYCTPSCAVDSDCAGGFVCKTATSQCVVADTKVVAPSPYGNDMGDPCEGGGGSLWPGQKCKGGLQCVAFGYRFEDAYKCGTHEQCAGAGWGPNGYCDLTKGDGKTWGYCSASFCYALCNLDMTCPSRSDGKKVCGGDVGFGCVCATPGYVECTGDSPLGGPCFFNNVWPDSFCKAGMSCVGAPASTSQPSCTTNADCAAAGLGKNGYCDLITDPAHGHCGFSICVEPCAGDKCYPDPSQPDVPVCSEIISGSCFCGTADYFQCPGDRKPGEPCSFGDDHDVFGKYATCVDGSSCLGFNNTVPCAAPNDNDQYCRTEYELPTAKCDAGTCRGAFCAATCVEDEGGNEVCPDPTEGGEALWPVSGMDDCMCAPYPVGAAEGTKTVGEPCQIGYMGADVFFRGQYCGTGLTCITNESDGVNACGSAAECRTPYGANGACTAGGYCGYGFCGKACAAGDTCAEGTVKAIGAGCFCVPTGSPVAAP